MFQKDMKVSLLLDFYGVVLSERKRTIMGMYYEEDLSLSEIAEETGISRQGVRDSIQKSVRELEELENKLGLADRFEKARRETEAISSLLSTALKKSDSEKNAIIEKAIEKLNSIEL